MVSSKFRRQALEYHLPVIDGRVCVYPRGIFYHRRDAIKPFPVSLTPPPPSPIDMTIIVAGSGTRDNPFRRPRNEFPDIYVSFDPLEEVTNSNVATLQQHDLHPNQFPQFPSPEFPNPSIYRFSDIFAQ